MAGENTGVGAACSKPFTVSGISPSFPRKRDKSPKGVEQPKAGQSESSKDVKAVTEAAKVHGFPLSRE
jgi:hypothetical protein